MPLLIDSNYQLCLSMNFGALKSTPSTCVEAVLAAADKAASNKAASDKAASNALAKAAQAPQVTAKKVIMKKSSLTRVKSKSIKKVLGVKPKCPLGYVKKR